MNRTEHVDLREAIREAQIKHRTVFYREDGARHDRGRTSVGASTLGGCSRRFAFERGGFPPNPGTEPHNSAGIWDRGDAVEWKVCERLRQAVGMFGLELIMAGNDQRTIVKEPLSATPDGVIANPTNKTVHFPLDNGDIYLEPGTSCIVEFKSVDPRVNIGAPKPQHVLQAQVQIALIWTSEHNRYKPTEGIIIYTDCSDHNRRSIFKVEQPEPGFLAAQMERAQKMLEYEDPTDAPAEGRFTGDCDYCPFTAPCGEAMLKYRPETSTTISTNAAPELDKLVADRFIIKAKVDAMVAEQKEKEENIKEFLHNHETNVAETKLYKVKWTEIKPKRIKTAKVREKHPEVVADPDCWSEGAGYTKLTITKRS